MEKVLLDTDIGGDIDDAICLAYLLKEPQCELVGITTVCGEPEKRAAVADAICRAAGKRVPIVAGPVSYTHLDVYKRQGREIPGLNPAKKRFSRKRRFFLAVSGAILLIVCIFAEIVGLRFQNADYQYQRALRYIQAGAFDMACAYAERAVRLAPDESEYLAAYAVCLAQTGLREETDDVCFRILELDASNEQAYRALVAIYEEDGEYAVSYTHLIRNACLRRPSRILLWWFWILKSSQRRPMRIRFL